MARYRPSSDSPRPTAQDWAALRRELYGTPRPETDPGPGPSRGAMVRRAAIDLDYMRRKILRMESMLRHYRHGFDADNLAPYNSGNNERRTK